MGTQLLFYVFEIAYGICFELIGCRFITDDDAVLVHLQDADRPHVIDAAFNGMMQSAGFLVAGGNNQYFFRIHNRANADGENRGRHFAFISTKKARIGLYGF